MNDFKKYIKGETDSVDAETLTSVIKNWEWFVTPRIIRAARENDADSKLFMHGMFHSTTYENIEKQRIERAYDDCIIDRFLDSGDYKIDETANEAQVSEPDGFIIDGADELLTEELAEVYLKQGLFEQAREIYRRLSLLYPKKSIYFAELIERMENENKQLK